MTIITPPPPPAPTAPPPLSAGGRTAIRVVLVVAAALLVFGGVAAVGSAALGLSTFRAVTDTKELPAGMRSLSIDTGDVPVAIRVVSDESATQPRIDMRLVHSTRTDDHQLTVRTDSAGTTASFDDASPGFLDWARAAEVRVVLPPQSARALSLTVQQRMGLLSVQTDLDTLIARTNSGAILLGGSARSIEADTQNGSVDTSGPIRVTESLTASTIHGPIDLELATAPRTVQASTRDGDITLELPAGDGPYQVRAQSGQSATVRVPQTTDADAPQVTARSENGEVSVEQLD